MLMNVEQLVERPRSGEAALKEGVRAGVGLVCDFGIFGVSLDDTMRVFSEAEIGGAIRVRLCRNDDKTLGIPAEIVMVSSTELLQDRARFG